MERPYFTVNIAVYNQLEELKMILASLKRQTFQDFEVIVCDDGSDDGTTEFMRRDENDDIRYIWQNDKGFRLAKSKNNGIMAAKGKYFVSLEGDVIPNFRMLEEYKMWGKLDRIMLGVRHDILKMPKKLDYRILDKKIVAKDFRMADLRNYKNIIKQWRLCSGCNFAVSTDKLKDIGGWDEFYTDYGIDDWDVCLRLIMEGCWVLPVPGAYGYHIRHEQRESPPENLARLEKLEREYER